MSWGVRLVLGVPDGAYLAQASPAGLEAFETQITSLQDAGFAVQRIPILNDIDVLTEHNVQIMAAEIAQVHREWFAAYEPRYRPRTAKLIHDSGPCKPGKPSVTAYRYQSPPLPTLHASPGAKPHAPSSAAVDPARRERHPAAVRCSAWP